MNEESIINACEGCKYVVHTASPFPVNNPKNENELIKPAVEGTLAAMKGALKHKCSRVVITSSVAAIYKSTDKKKTHFTDEDWTDLSVATAYEKSKTQAEKAAWDFLANLKEEDRFEVVTINPGLILGPNLVECSFSSGDIIKKIMTGGMPGMPKIQFPCVDVRDVAQAHLQAVLVPEAASKRFILVNEGVWFMSIGEWLHEKWGKKFPVVHKSLPKCLLTLASLWDAEARTVKPFWGVIKTFDNQNTKDVLGIQFTDMKQSVCEMSETLVATGYVPQKKK